MKHLIIIVLVFLVVSAFSSCVVRPVARTSRPFKAHEYKTRHHWGAPKRFTLHNRYWGSKRYGPRVHPYRGAHHY